MEIINSPIYVKLTDADRKALHDAYVILDELYEIIYENDCAYANNTLMNEGYDRCDISLAANVLRAFSPADQLAITE